MLKWWAPVELIVIRELSNVPLADDVAAELLSEMLSQRYQRGTRLRSIPDGRQAAASIKTARLANPRTPRRNHIGVSCAGFYASRLKGPPFLLLRSDIVPGNREQTSERVHALISRISDWMWANARFLQFWHAGFRSCAKVRIAGHSGQIHG